MLSEWVGGWGQIGLLLVSFEPASFFSRTVGGLEVLERREGRMQARGEEVRSRER